MKKSTKSKWVVGIAGTAFSAFVLSQIVSGDANTENQKKDGFYVDAKVYASMNDKEKELVELDWTNFTITEGSARGDYKSDRQTRRS